MLKSRICLIRLRSRIWWWQMLDSLDICSTKEREESKINPRLRADLHGSREWVEGKESDGLDILENCLGRTISMNSVSNGFRVRRLAVVQEEIEEIVLLSWETTTRKFFGTKEMKRWVSLAYKWWESEDWKKQSTEWSSIEIKNYRTKDIILRNTTEKRKGGREMEVYGDRERR